MPGVHHLLDHLTTHLLLLHPWSVGRHVLTTKRLTWVETALTSYSWHWDPWTDAELDDILGCWLILGNHLWQQYPRQVQFAS